jgi:hypothetical protein
MPNRQAISIFSMSMPLTPNAMSSQLGGGNIPDPRMISLPPCARVSNKSALMISLLDFTADGGLPDQNKPENKAHPPVCFPSSYANKAKKKTPRGGLDYSFVFGLRGPRIKSGATQR